MYPKGTTNCSQNKGTAIARTTPSTTCICARSPPRRLSPLRFTLGTSHTLSIVHHGDCIRCFGLVRESACRDYEKVWGCFKATNAASEFCKSLAVHLCLASLPPHARTQATPVPQTVMLKGFGWFVVTCLVLVLALVLVRTSHTLVHPTPRAS